MKKALMATTLLFSMIRGAWAIEPHAAEAYKPLVHAMLSGKDVNLQSLMPQRASVAVRNIIPTASAPIAKYNYQVGFSQAPKNSIALVQLEDVVMKYDFCGSAGTQSMARMIAEADANPNIKGILISIDSPGGSVNGTMDLASAVKACTKPVVAHAHGMICSAAYWIGSAANHIMLSNETVIVGSIGTMLTLEDWSGYMEANGIKVHEIYASASTDKNGTYRAALGEDYEPIRNETLNPLNDQFTAAVRKNRYGKKLNPKETLTGKTFVGSAAINVGLADSIGSVQDAVDLILKLSTKA